MPKISDLTASTELTDDDLLVLVNDPAGTPGTRKITALNAATYFGSGTPQPLEYAISPEGEDATTGTAKLTVRAPYELTLTDVRLSAAVASSLGTPTVDINVDSSTVLSTKLTLDVNEKTSETAASAAVISTSYVADDAEITFDIDTAGTGTRGLKVKLYHTLGGTPPASDIEFIAETHTTYTTRTNTTVTKPTGTTNGDLVLLGILTGTAAEAVDPTPPAGFTLLTGYPIDATDGSFNVETRIYYKIASSEGADWTFTHTSTASQGFALTFRNVHASTPIDVNPSTNTGTGSTSTATGVTTVTNNAMVIYFGHDWGSNNVGNLTPPTGTTPTFTEFVDPGGTTNLIYLAGGLLATAGATGNKTQTNNNTPASSDTWGASLIALRPA